MDNLNGKIIRLLLVEDDADFRDALCRRLARRGFEISQAVSAEDALLKLDNDHFDVVVADIKLPGMDGVEFLAKVRTCKDDMPVILVTGYASLESAKEAVKLNASDYLLKPLENIDELLNPIYKAVYSYGLLLENKHLTDDLKRKVVELERSERLNHDIIEKSPIGIYVVNERGAVDYVNATMAQISGEPQEELVKTNVFELPAYKAMGLVDLIRDGLNGKYFKIGPVSFTSDVGKKTSIRNFIGVPFVGKEDKKLIVMVEDITALKETERQLLRALDDWRTTFDSITDMVMMVDPDLKIVKINKTAANLCGQTSEQLIGTFCYEIIHETKKPNLLCPLKKVLETKKACMMEFFEPHLHMHLEETASPICDTHGAIVGIVLIAKDITQRKAVEKAQRLSQLGQLLADMAHEIRSPIMIIAESARFALSEINDNKEVRKSLDIICNQAERMQDITQRLLGVSRPAKGEIKEVDINKNIEDIVLLVERQFILSNIQIKRGYAKDLPPVHVDGKQLQEVYLNLLNNARDAMAQGGCIEISTSVDHNHLKIDFADTGSGMSEEGINRLFEPFYTTREKGTGLGLSICYSIIKSHNGDMCFKSKIGEGTTATILLPLQGGTVDV